MLHKILSSASPHLVRRALSIDEANEAAQKYVEVLKEIPGWGWAVLILSSISLAVLLWAVSYTLQIVFVLACVESTEQGYTLTPSQPPDYKDIDDANNKASDPLMQDPADPESNIRSHKPVTAKIRATIRHLQAVGGYRARFRGFWLSVVWVICLSIVTDVLSAVFNFTGLNILTMVLPALIGRILFSQWEMAWTHIVISNPSHLPWYRRTLPWRSWKKIIWPTTLNSLIAFLAVAPGALLFFAFSFHKKLGEGESFTGGDLFKLLAILLLTIVLEFAVCLPADVALARQQASMLSPEEEPIVQFDRSFGGRVAREAQGGAGVLGFAEAWKSLSKEAVGRVLKLVFKIIFIEIALVMLCYLVMGVEVMLIAGPAFQKAHDLGLLNLPTADYAAAAGLLTSSSRL